MSQYSVKWYKPKESPRSSYWFEYAGVITYASAKLSAWTGKRHGDLVAHLHSHGYYVSCVSSQPIPQTMKYHKELLASVTALLDLLK